jgi:PhnB protein
MAKKSRASKKSKSKAKPKRAARKVAKKAAPKKKAAARKAAPAKKRAVRRVVARPVSRPKPLPKGLAPGCQWINAYLTVPEVESAIDFYQKGFGFKVKGTIPGPDGRLNHAELMHNDSLLMLGPANPNLGAFAPQGPSPVILYSYVEDVDALAARAMLAGARVVREPRDEMWGDRCCVIIDPAGHSWMFATHQRVVSMEEMGRIQQQGGTGEGHDNNPPIL